MEITNIGGASAPPLAVEPDLQAADVPDPQPPAGSDGSMIAADFGAMMRRYQVTRQFAAMTPTPAVTAAQQPTYQSGEPNDFQCESRVEVTDQPRVVESLYATTTHRTLLVSLSPLRYATRFETSTHQ